MNTTDDRNVISIPSSKRDCLYLSPSATVYLISPHVQGR